MAATEERLKTLETRVGDLASDLRVLRALVDQDHASALNKIRYVTEKVLHRLCQEHGVSWGTGEPTVENMIGPLIAKKVIPKNVAIHVRTIQTNASPGSHFQETPLTATHVQVAQMALLDFLEWFYKVEAAAAAPAAVRVVERRSRRPLVVGAAVMCVGGGFAAFALTRHHHEAEPNLRRPEAGLHALDVYRSPHGSEITTLDSIPYWQNAERDLREAAAQPGAPAEWTADADFAAAMAAARSGKLADAASGLRKTIAEAPRWALPHAAIAIVLAQQGQGDAAIQEAQQAQRLDATWWGGVAAEARAYVRGDKLETAIQTYRRALQLAPKQPVLLAELALVYHAQHLDSEADRYAKEALAADADMVPAHLLLAERALEDGKADVAVTEATAAVASAPDHLSTRLALADAFALAGRKDEALSNYRRAIEIWRALGDHPAGEHDDRMKLVEQAVGSGELPMSREDERKQAAQEGFERSQSEMETVEGKAAAEAAIRKALEKQKKAHLDDNRSHTEKAIDNRSRPCEPGDPLCSDY